MKHAVKKLSDTHIEITLTLDASDLAPLRSNTVARLAKKVKAPGFRPGKVPAGVAAKQLDSNYLNQEALEDAVNATASSVLEAEKVTPLDRPKVDVGAYVPGESLEYTLSIEIVPDVKLGDYTTLKAKKKKVVVQPKDIDEVMERLQASMAIKTDADRPAKNGDEVILNFSAVDAEGTDVPGASGKDYPLTLGSNTFIPGFEKVLIGKKASETFELPLTFPADYHHKPLAGAKVIFTVTVVAVKDIQTPALDDAFAAKAGPFKTLADLKADVKRELNDQKEREAIETLKDALIEELIKNSHVPTPDVLIADQLASIERDFVQNLMYRGITLEQYVAQKQLTKDEWRDKEVRPQAVRRVQIGLALAELSKLENIEVTRQELEARLQEMVQRHGNTPDIATQIDTAEGRRDIANRVMTEKTLDRLLEINTKK